MLSFEKCKELQRAGFPQPEKQFGQFWYSPNGKIHVIGDNTTTNPSNPKRVARNLNDVGFQDLWAVDDAIFCPTAENILWELEKGEGNVFSLWFYPDAPKNRRVQLETNGQITFGETLVEACADMYIQLANK